MKSKSSVMLAVLLIMVFAISSLGLDSISVSSIKLSTSSITIQPGKTIKLKVSIIPSNATNKKLTFLSSNRKIASVDKNGVVKGIIPGKTTITVTSASNKKAVAKCVVNVSTYSKRLKLTWVVYNYPDFPAKPGTDAQKIIEKMFNVDLTIPLLDNFNEEQFTVFWASGNKADHIVGNLMGKYWQKFADQGILRPVKKEMIYEFAPDLMDTVEELVDPKIVSSQMAYKGKVWMLPYTNPAPASQTYIMAARRSWMDKVGIKKSPETLDEFHTLAYKFTWNDPDGNGKNDTYGLHRNDWMDFDYVWGAFGIIPNSYYDIDDKIVYTSAINKYKEGLKLLSKWYKEGIIDPEIVTDDRKIQRSKWADGKFGLLEDHPWWFAASTPDNLTAMVQKKFPDEKLVFFNAVKGSDGTSGARIGYPGITNNATYFGGDTSDEKVIRIMQIKNEMVSNKDLYLKLFYGEKGKTYDIDKEGIIIPKPEFQTSQKISELGLADTFAYVPFGMDIFYKSLRKSDEEPYRVSTSNKKAFAGTAFITNGVNNANKTKGADIAKITKEFYYNSITGKINVDAEWDKYLSDLNKSGLQDVLNEFEKIVVR